MKLKHFYLLILAFILNKVAAQSTASKQVTKFIIAAPQLDTLKTIWVYLPEGYETSKKSFPVIYMHDAQNLFDAKTAYAGEWQVDEYLDSLTDNQSIIIGIEHGNKKRINELTPYPNETYGGGKGEAYLTFIKNTVKPHIDMTYRTKPEAEHTTIFGSSLGGLLSFYATLKHPETFGKAGVFSPAFWINPEIFDLVKTTEIPETSKFYFLAGTDEGETMIPKLEKMTTLLKSKGIKETQFKVHKIEGGQHNEKFWAAHFGEAYQYLTTND
ncbi:MAG: alpha/beta hydrolase [Winogradskyella sp.]|uniref:alpha/beta hydrolase n=1 Tax=Winogradskyella sp. TaxID=1883156 RepID=UPI00385FC610